MTTIYYQIVEYEHATGVWYRVDLLGDDGKPDGDLWDVLPLTHEYDAITGGFPTRKLAQQEAEKRGLAAWVTP
jgi:hypothetical protein